MIGAVWRIVRERDDFDEAFQDALARVWARLDQIERHPNPQALILRICINAAYDVLRRRVRQRRREVLDGMHESIADSHPPADDVLAAAEQRGEIMAAVSRLPRNQAEAFLMRFIDEMPYPEIAQALGCGEPTVRTHILRARRRLGQWLAHLDPRPPREACK